MRLPPALTAVLGVQVGSCSGFFIFSKRDGLRVLSPHGGDRLSTGITIDIEWETSSDEKVKIEVRKGPPDALTTVHNIASDAPNNGTYKWRSNEDNFLDPIINTGLPDSAPSACDYIIAIRDTKTTANSQYFTIISQEDDGLPEDAKCPAPNDSPGNGPGTIRDEAGGQAEGANNGTAPSTNSATSAPSQVSRATLGGAVGGTAAGLLFIFAAVIFFGRSRGWFVDKEFIKQQVALAAADVPPPPPSETKYDFNAPNNVILRNDQSREINSANVYQMPANRLEK